MDLKARQLSKFAAAGRRTQAPLPEAEAASEQPQATAARTTGPRIFIDVECPVCGARGMSVRYSPGPAESRALAVCPGCGHCWAV
jgi:hypothetical protein